MMSLAPSGMPPLGKQRLCISFITIISHMFYIQSLYDILPLCPAMPYIGKTFTKIMLRCNCINIQRDYTV